jgi:hypothetical protein
VSSLKVVFIVQGEGRGHMTQALALATYLRDAGHEVTHALVGRSPWRSVPQYFRDGIAAPVTEFDAPAQVPDRDGRALSLPRTLSDAVRRLPTFVRSLDTIAQSRRGADVVVNFLDLLGGLSNALRPGPEPVLALAHNHVFLHPHLRGAPGPHHLRRAVLAYARATALGADRCIALSFDELPSHPAGWLRVAPPLLRPGLDRLRCEDGGYLLAYVLNRGYAGRLAEWQRQRGDVSVHCYVDGGNESLGRGTDVPDGFFAHDLDAGAFLRHLGGCRALVGSAGFESLCEAHYLGKPVLAIPTEGQFEQTLNAWDAQRCGVARPGSYDDLDAFWSSPPAPAGRDVTRFREWVSRAPAMLVTSVEQTARVGSG